PRPGRTHPDLIDWLSADSAAFSRSLKGSALSRAKRAGLLRNASAILGTRRERRAVPALAALLDDPDPLIRTSAARALGAIATSGAFDALTTRRDDPDPSVREAVRRVLEASGR